MSSELDPTEMRAAAFDSLKELKGLLTTTGRPNCECVTDPGSVPCTREAVYRLKAVTPAEHTCPEKHGCLACLPHTEMFRYYFEAGALRCETCPQKVTGIELTPIGAS